MTNPLFKSIEFDAFKNEEESDWLKPDWNLQRTLAKVNYPIHTDAIKENLILNKIAISQMKTFSGLQPFICSINRNCLFLQKKSTFNKKPRRGDTLVAP